MDPKTCRPRLTRVLALTTMALAMTLVPLASATHVSPTFVEKGNKTCSDFATEGEAWKELKVDPARDGVYTSADGNLMVTVDFDENTKTFDWTANLDIVGIVFVKAGNAGNNLYAYDPPSSGDSDLASPGAGTTNAISHVSFCYTNPPDVPTCEDNPEMPECQPTCEEQPEMPECQPPPPPPPPPPPTCEDQPEMPECQPTCEDQPEMPECQPTCEDNPDMPECQPTCEEQPDMEECPPTCLEVPEACEPTCDDQPDMPECQPTCDDNPDMPVCQPTCEDQPEMPECPQEEQPCVASMVAVANADGSITVTITASGESELYRKAAGGSFVLVGSFDGDDVFVDTTVTAGTAYTYKLVVDGEQCDLVEVSAIPDFPMVVGAIAAVGLGAAGYAFMRRKK